MAMFEWSVNGFPQDGLWRLEYTGRGPLDNEEGWEITFAKWNETAKWLFNASEYAGLENGGPSTCGLCMLYFGSGSCTDCPISRFTGRGWCGGTPYEDWEEAQYDNDHERLATLAAQELDFLRLVHEGEGK